MVDALLRFIKEKLRERETLLLALDGRCASGKSTLAEEVRQALDCTVIHMDDFFLRPEQRTPERFATPGENVDHERFLQEVLLPLCSGKPFSFRPYDCSQQALAEPVSVEPRRVCVVEGSYSCHPDLWPHYDAHVFLTVDPDVQLERILVRNGAQMQRRFAQEWIPLEEKYFAAYDLQARCELVLKS